MEYCSSYNGIAYQHSPQHSHDIRNGYDSGLYGLYGHNQHINHHHHQHHHPHQYGTNRNAYDAYKANLGQNYHQPLSYGNNFESSYEPTTSATATPSAAAFRPRFGGYQCEMQQCFPANGSQDNHRGEYAPANSNISRCLDPLANHIGLPDPRSHGHHHHHPHHHHHQQQQPYGHESTAHHAPHSMRMPLGYHRTYDSLHPKMMSRPSFESEPHQSWYGYSNESPHHHHPHPNHQHHPHHPHQPQQQHQHQQQQQLQHHHAHSTNNNNEYSPHMHGPNGNPYSTSATLNGQLATAKEDKALKMHRDRSLSKLVAMNRRLETQMNESERSEPYPYDHHFENFDYYTDFSETPESITSSSQFTNNDCMINSVTSETDNNNNIDGAVNNSHNKNNCKEMNNRRANDSTDSEWLTTMAITSTTTTTTTPTTIIPSKEAATTTSSANVSSVDSREEHLDNESKVSNENEHTKKNDLPPATAVNKSPAKLNANKKNAKSKKMTYGNTMDKRRKRRERKPNIHYDQIKDSKQMDAIPLPGFQQTLPGFQEAFGSTEIGRFSEIFFNASGSPIEIGLFESEADTLSPQPWEMGDSLEGPHFSMQTNNTPLSYTESLGSTDSPTASNNSFFSELHASEF